MKKELSVNERAKRGIPSLALMEGSESLYGMEGFDDKGYLWYYVYSSRMEPVIPVDTFVALQRVPSLRDIIKGIKRLYLFVYKDDKGRSWVWFGYVINDVISDGFVRVETVNPVKDFTDLPNDSIVEQYRIMFALRALPGTLSFKETLKEDTTQSLQAL